MRKYLVVSALFLIVGFAQLSFGATWTIEQVTNNTEPDDYPFVVAVQSGLMVVYCHHDPDFEVFVANNFSGPWTSNRVTDNTHNDIGFDIAAKYSEQTAHIALMWEDTPDDEISYCKGSPGSWDIQRITDDANDDSSPSIALDNSGFVHVVYQKDIGGDNEIFYANNVTGSWITEQVTDNGSDDVCPWFALDKTGNPHVVFRNGPSLYYTRKTAGIWTAPELVTGATSVFSYPILVLDSDDKAHVTFAKLDGSYVQIYYANNVTGTWQESKVTSTSNHKGYPSIFIDPQNKIHIAYMDDVIYMAGVTSMAAKPADAEVFYANNIAGVWSTERVTDNSVIDHSYFGRYFTCDAQRIGHIFFWNDSDGDSEIYHAKSNEPLYAGIEETVPTPQVSILDLPGILTANSTITYSVPGSGKVSLKVYDVSGSLVKTLVDGIEQQGNYQVIWDGSTSAGSRATAGVYFFRLASGASTVSAKAILR